MNSPAVVRALFLLPLLAFLPCGCDKSDPAPPPAAQATATPAPTATPLVDADTTAERIKKKTGSALKALGGFLKTDDAKVQAKLQKLTDKIARDKDGWRKKLQEKRDELQPQIDQLKEQVGKAEGKSREEVDRQLASLEEQSHNAEEKLSSIDGAVGENWKKIKTRLKDEEAKNGLTKDDDAATPVPTPSATPTP